MLRCVGMAAAIADGPRAQRVDETHASMATELGVLDRFRTALAQLD